MYSQLAAAAATARQALDGDAHAASFFIALLRVAVRVAG